MITSASHRIAADPTSVALLLADPTVVELWPAVTRSSEPSPAGLVKVKVDGASGALRLLPPSRTPTSFILRFDVEAGDHARVEGRLELTHGTGRPAQTDAVLELRAPRDLSGAATEFLRAVAAVAEERANAA